MAGNYIGCLAVTEGSDPKGKVIGVVTERDYLKKVALLGKESKTTKVREICVYNPITVDQDEPIDDCMKKMLDSDIRHLLIRDKAGEILSVMSIKDCIKVSVARHDEFVRKIAGFAFGKTF
jgi:CBS domain-containing protein